MCGRNRIRRYQKIICCHVWDFVLGDVASLWPLLLIIIQDSDPPQISTCYPKKQTWCWCGCSQIIALACVIVWHLVSRAFAGDRLEGCKATFRTHCEHHAEAWPMCFVKSLSQLWLTIRSGYLTKHPRQGMLPTQAQRPEVTVGIFHWITFLPLALFSHTFSETWLGRRFFVLSEGRTLWILLQNTIDQRHAFHLLICLGLLQWHKDRHLQKILQEVKVIQGPVPHWVSMTPIRRTIIGDQKCLALSGLAARPRSPQIRTGDLPKSIDIQQIYALQAQELRIQTCDSQLVLTDPEGHWEETCTCIVQSFL